MYLRYFVFKIEIQILRYYLGKADFRSLLIKSGFVLAGLEDYQYKQGEIQLFIGDEMFFYTDGVTEATNSKNMLYGEQRLLDCLTECYDYEISEQIKMVKNNIDAFVAEAEQFDDITIMAMRITSPEED